MKIVIVGSGNVAESLAQAIAEAEGLEIGEYDVRFAFVPEGADANVDCAITFTND